MNETKRRKEDNKKGGAKDRLREKNNSNDVTWVKAAISVLQRFNEPLSHKDILKIIQDERIKECGKGNVPLACLNTMLNSHCRGPNPVFYRVPGPQAYFGLLKRKPESPEEILTSLKQFSTTEESQPSNAVQGSISGETGTRQGTPSTPKTTAQDSAVRNSTVKVSPMTTPTKPPNGSMNTRPRGSGTFLHSKHGLALQRAPGAALRVMPPKKRAKLNEDDVLKDKDKRDNCQIKSEDITKGVNTRVSNQRRPESTKSEASVTNVTRQMSSTLLTQTLQQPRRNRVPPSSNNNAETRPSARSRQVQPSGKQSGKPQLRMIPSKKTNTKVTGASSDSLDEAPRSPQEEPKKTGAGFLEVKLKKLKKMSLAEQIKRLREGKVDIVTPDSVLTSVNIKSLFSWKSFGQLPPAYQYQLMMLLPDVDRYIGDDNALRLNPSALNNEFFTQACQEWREKLADGEFNVDIIQKIKQEEENSSQPKLDPWKGKYFEPAYGKRTADDIPKKKPNSKKEGTPWSVFVKFAESANECFVKEFKKIQSKARSSKSERDKRMKSEDRKSDALHLNRKSGSRGPASPKTPKGPCKNEIVGKSRSKRALKRAQLLQRKKAFGKQLQEAKAKMVQNARMEARKSMNGPVSGNGQGDDQVQARLLDSIEDSAAQTETKVTPLVIKRSRFQKSYRVIEKEGVDSSSKNKLKRNQDGDVNGENECSTDDVKILMEDAVKSAVSTATGTTLNINDAESQDSYFSNSQSGAVNRSAKSPRDSRRRALTASNSGGKFKSSRVIRAASIYARASNSSCPCSLAPMVICQRCGAFCHQDCIDSDKICTLCIPA